MVFGIALQMNKLLNLLDKGVKEVQKEACHHPQNKKQIRV